MTDIITIEEDVTTIVVEEEITNIDADDVGIQGPEGAPIEFRVSAGWIQFRHVREEPEPWTNLIALTEITGPAGESIELRNSGTALEWRVVGETEWITFVTLSELVGPRGFSAYEVATQNGFVGTEAEWLQSFREMGDVPAFAARLTTDQTGIVNSTWTKVAYQTEDWDSRGWFANGRFTPQEAGWYLVGGLATMEALPDQRSLLVALYKNGEMHGMLSRGIAGATGYNGYSGAIMVNLNGTTDYVELFVFHNQGSNMVLEGSNTTTNRRYNHFWGFKVGARVSAPYVHTQSVPAATWSVTHNLGYWPSSIRVQDSAEDEIDDFDIVNETNNSFDLVFSGAFSGVARIK